MHSIEFNLNYFSVLNATIPQNIFKINHIQKTEFEYTFKFDHAIKHIHEALTKWNAFIHVKCNPLWYIQQRLCSNKPHYNTPSQHEHALYVTEIAYCLYSYLKIKCGRLYFFPFAITRCMNANYCYECNKIGYYEKCFCMWCVSFFHN